MDTLGGNGMSLTIAGNRVHLRSGEGQEIARATKVCLRTVRRVSGAKVTVWTGEAEMVREELLRRGRCPACYRSESRNDRWRPTETPDEAPWHFWRD